MYVGQLFLSCAHQCQNQAPEARCEEITRIARCHASTKSHMRVAKSPVGDWGPACNSMSREKITDHLGWAG
ncbi:hypothetical protein E2562_007449 [Oryza meyeriana var. granulata]|uniref:Uncharacterized protein n=1 Tax=Oryza meyeriana var. granulata TaxID=110450 RepID=A0A6G1CZV7_9ORYZ|nr:hypothetical protein E2562_007449 [Oryza meyeriana var. granulata]